MRNYWEPKGKRGHRNAQKLADELRDEWVAEQGRMYDELLQAEAEADTEPMRRAEPLEPRYVRTREW